jgi:hypothetical protein
MGLLEVQMPPTGGTVELAYGPGPAEAVGAGLSAASLLLLGVLGWRRRRARVVTPSPA